MASQITPDSQDCEKTRKMLVQCINLVDTASHPPEQVHVASGKINSDKYVNVEEAVSLGTNVAIKVFLLKTASRFSQKFGCRSQSENDAVRHEKNANWGCTGV